MLLRFLLQHDVRVCLDVDRQRRVAKGQRSYLSEAPCGDAGTEAMEA